MDYPRTSSDATSNNVINRLLRDVELSEFEESDVDTRAVIHTIYSHIVCHFYK